MKKRRYDWTPDPPDWRDYKYSAIAPVIPTLPPAIDLRNLCSAVEDQGNLGSCTANAIVGAMELLEIRDKKQFTDFSRLFLYYNERAIEGTTAEDSGAFIRDGIKTLVVQGVCHEPTWPYNIAKFAKKPSKTAYQQGLAHQIKAYRSIRSLTEMKTCLATQVPFVFGFSVYESFESAEVAKSGIVPMPAPSEKLLGGHAVLAVGYDDAVQRFIVRNSWGPRWGVKGYFTIPYAYLSNSDLADDFWMIETGEQI